MTDDACLYTLLHAEPGQHDPLLIETIGPLARSFQDRAEIHSLFIARYNKPDWQLRFRVLGRPEWIHGEVRRRIEDALPEARSRGRFTEVEFARYDREWERYGGPVGMPLCEKIFFHDTMACLAVIDAEAAGEAGRSRREWSLLFVERFLDLFRLPREERIVFYRFGQSWPFTLGEWHDEETAILERKYQTLREGLRALFSADAAARPDALWGGSRPAAAAGEALARMKPVCDALLAAHADGGMEIDLVNLAWSLMHMHCNRLGIDAVAEAILRYYMYRLHQDAGAPVA